MSRYLIFVLLVCVLYWMIRGERRAAIKRRQTPPAAPRPVIEGEAMVACAVCDLHLPVSEAVAGRPPTAGQWFCCDAHRMQFERGAVRRETDVAR